MIVARLKDGVLSSKGKIYSYDSYSTGVRNYLPVLKYSDYFYLNNRTVKFTDVVDFTKLSKEELNLKVGVEHTFRMSFSGQVSYGAMRIYFKIKQGGVVKTLADKMIYSSTNSGNHDTKVVDIPFMVESDFEGVDSIEVKNYNNTGSTRFFISFSGFSIVQTKFSDTGKSIMNYRVDKNISSDINIIKPCIKEDSILLPNISIGSKTSFSTKSNVFKGLKENVIF